MDFETISNEVQRLRFKQSEIEQQLRRLRRSKRKLVKDIEALKQASEIIRSVANQTLEDVTALIEDLVTPALQIISPYLSFHMELVSRRNQVECDMYVYDSQLDKKMSPLDMGGGVVDIISFALRLAFWKLSKDDRQNTLILDEPFKFVSADIPDEELLKSINRELGLQIIGVTHKEKLVDTLEDGKDTVIRLYKDDKGVTRKR